MVLRRVVIYDLTLDEGLEHRVISSPPPHGGLFILDSDLFNFDTVSKSEH